MSGSLLSILKATIPRGAFGSGIVILQNCSEPISSHPYRFCLRSSGGCHASLGMVHPEGLTVGGEFKIHPTRGGIETGDRLAPIQGSIEG